jgi:tripartite-type tricarboxylate transporter receptor subunit TctC
MLHVPYQGGAPAFNALLSNQVPVVPTLESIAKGHLQSGDVRVLAHWGTQPQASFPDAPALKDVGYPDVEYLLWAGLFAPRGTPEPVVKILRDAVRPYMQEKQNLQRFITAGSQPAYLDGPEFAKFLETDNARLVKVTKLIGLS